MKIKILNIIFVSVYEQCSIRKAVSFILLFLNRSLKGRNGENVFSGCISQLVLQSREFDLLLGRLEPDSRRTPGIIDKFKVGHSW